jgi:hypothetical protein
LKKLLIVTLALTLAAPAAAQVQYFSAGKKAPIEGQWQGQAPEPTAEQPAAAQELAPAPQTRVVTSLQKCLDQLEPEEQAIVKSNYNKPYQTCHSMLAAKAGKKKKAAKKAAEEPEAENARNFVRIQDERTAGTAAAEEPEDYAGDPEPAPAKKRKKKSFFDFEIKADKSKANFNR